MFWLSFFSSRLEKKKFLTEIIERLQIQQEEKDIYKLCLDVLDDAEFHVFYEKIYLQIERSDEQETISSIEPFSSKLL